MQTEAAALTFQGLGKIDSFRQIMPIGGMILRKLWMTVTLMACATTLSAQESRKKPSFDDHLTQVRSHFSVDATGLHGQAPRPSPMPSPRQRYVMIGEDHLSREIPMFARGLCRLMAPDGLRAFAVETGPEAARIVNAHLRRPDRIARLTAFMQTHPDSMAFQNGRDESDMAADCAAMAGPDFSIWGLDQEFFGASGFLLEQMQAAHPGPVARAAIAHLVDLDRAATQKAVASDRSATCWSSRSARPN